MSPPSRELLALLEYRLQAVEIGRLAWEFASGWHRTPLVQTYLDGIQVIEGSATAFTNGAIEAALIHCRALLEFLGLHAVSDCRLKETPRRRRDNRGIESISGLVRLTVEDALHPYAGRRSEAEAALAYVGWIANKRLAQTTAADIAAGRGAELVEVAFRGVPALVIPTSTQRWAFPPPSTESRGASGNQDEEG